MNVPIVHIKPSIKNYNDKFYKNAEDVVEIVSELLQKAVFTTIKKERDEREGKQERVMEQERE